MKKITTVITSVILCVTMLILGPAQVAASAAESAKKTYISEVKVGMGVKSEEAAKELLAEGFTILTDDSGQYADLNKDAGSKSILKKGPNQKIVYLGYKTTEDADDAITDLAVMNMDGGYSFQDYEKLMDTHMDTQIKPFVDRFIATLTEYRENLKKPKDSINYKRANYYRMLLNLLTDDDTGGKPLGDLLINQTKYEMGDEAYNKLSEEEKKNHCDILTLLMQGNGQAVQLMETELTKSADAADNTWLDRFLATDLEALKVDSKTENPHMTPSEINEVLDKKYHDDAKKIRDKWGAFNEILLNYDNAVNNANEAAEADVDSKEITLTDKSTDKEIEEAASNLIDVQAAQVKGGMAAEDIVAHDYLEATEYGDGTLLEFFERDQSEFFDEDTIRELYPIVEALSGGQIAGLDFLSIKDMILMAVTDENGFKAVNVDDLASASIFQDVNREIYERGGVALTNDALRQKSSAKDAVTTFQLSTLGVVLWSCTAAAGIAAAGSALGMTLKPDILKQADILQKTVDSYGPITKSNMYGDLSTPLAQRRAMNRLIFLKNKPEYIEASKQFATRSTVCKYLTAGFSIAAALLAGYSIYTTISEMMEYYKVDFSPIPKYIVDEADITAKNEMGETIMIQNQTAYYKVVSCNRKQGSSDVEKKNFEILKDRNDLNGDVGKQWLSLYSVKYENGAPILADSLKVQWGTNSPDDNTTGIHRFGETAAFNLTSLFYCYNDPNNGTFVYYKHDNASVKEMTAAGSVFSGSSIALGGVIGLIVGCAVTAIIMTVAGKKKKKTALPA